MPSWQVQWKPSTLVFHDLILGIQPDGVTASSGTAACQAVNFPGSYKSLYDSMFYNRLIKPAGVTASSGTVACEAVNCQEVTNPCIIPCFITG